MRVLIQRVTSARVSVAGSMVAEIGKGYLLLVGVGGNDTEADVEWMARKIVNLRIFEDPQGKMNLNLQQAQGEILSVSQFTLYADTQGGNRPGFEPAAKPDKAQPLWDEFNQKLAEQGITVKAGVFGEHMQVTLTNDGPVSIWLDSADRPD